MPTLHVRRLARHTARSVSRRLAAAASRELARRGHPPAHESHVTAAAGLPSAARESTAATEVAAESEARLADPPADDARLDSLRVELVSALDSLAMRDPDCSGSFRRI